MPNLYPSISETVNQICQRQMAGASGDDTC
jgi:hypothetical protein